VSVCDDNGTTNVDTQFTADYDTTNCCTSVHPDSGPIGGALAPCSGMYTCTESGSTAMVPTILEIPDPLKECLWTVNGMSSYSLNSDGTVSGGTGTASIGNWTGNASMFTVTAVLEGNTTASMLVCTSNASTGTSSSSSGTTSSSSSSGAGD
jgi:hypothetical protein